MFDFPMFWDVVVPLIFSRLGNIYRKTCTISVVPIMPVQIIIEKVFSRRYTETTPWSNLQTFRGSISILPSQGECFAIECIYGIKADKHKGYL